MRAAKILMTVLLLGAPAWVAAQAARPTTGAPEIFSASAQAKNATGSVSGTLEVHVTATRRTSIARSWRKRSGWAATRGLSRPFGTLPRSGSSCSAEASRTAIRYARERVEGGGRTIVVVTDRPVFFLGGGRGETSKPRAGYEVAVVQIQLDGKGQGKGTMAAAARVRPDGAGGVLLDDYNEELITLTNITRKAS